LALVNQFDFPGNGLANNLIYASCFDTMG